ncbi:MAG: hypothetical protein ACI976_000641 [Aureispira sp.]|jgi:hypothetical protein
MLVYNYFSILLNVQYNLFFKLMFTSIAEKIDLFFRLREVFNEGQYNFNKSFVYF